MLKLPWCDDYKSNHVCLHYFGYIYLFYFIILIVFTWLCNFEGINCTKIIA
jgi:hypothetical protein